MAVTKISNSGIKTGNLKYDSMLAGNPAYDPAATWLIQRTTLSTDTATVTFSSIPSNYQHLQIRFIARNTSSYTANLEDMFIQMNGNTSAVYAAHALWGNGASALAQGANALNQIEFPTCIVSDLATANRFSAGVIDLHDYTSTTKNKTVRAFIGANQNDATNANQTAGLFSGLFVNTGAVTSITLKPKYNSWKTGSTFALYGFIGA